mmetsp:Transcript_6936/g.17075  ORF Transcript_6936/g.17075 Transcript_6936/m.17075 type:complete len:201 (+) Transcript_6936:859-1461(+)
MLQTRIKPLLLQCLAQSAEASGAPHFLEDRHGGPPVRSPSPPQLRQPCPALRFLVLRQSQQHLQPQNSNSVVVKSRGVLRNAAWACHHMLGPVGNLLPMSRTPITCITTNTLGAPILPPLERVHGKAKIDHCELQAPVPVVDQNVVSRDVSVQTKLAHRGKRWGHLVQKLLYLVHRLAGQSGACHEKPSSGPQNARRHSS